MAIESELVKGSTGTVVLRMLSRGEMYGYEIAREVNERTRGALEFKEGTLYPCLHQLEADGFLSSQWRDAPHGKERKYYRITRKGLRELTRRTEEWKGFSAAMNALMVGG